MPTYLAPALYYFAGFDNPATSALIEKFQRHVHRYRFWGYAELSTIPISSTPLSSTAADRPLGDPASSVPGPSRRTLNGSFLPIPAFACGAAHRKLHSLYKSGTRPLPGKRSGKRRRACLLVGVYRQRPECRSPRRQKRLLPGTLFALQKVETGRLPPWRS